VDWGTDAGNIDITVPVPDMCCYSATLKLLMQKLLHVQDRHRCKCSTGLD
jgi:hypothetical protein